MIVLNTPYLIMTEGVSFKWLSRLVLFLRKICSKSIQVKMVINTVYQNFWMLGYEYSTNIICSVTWPHEKREVGYWYDND